MPRFAALSLMLAALPSFAQQSTWYVLAHDDGCVELAVFARHLRLPRTPVSPDDFAAMMRERGGPATVAAVPGMPAELASGVVQVQLAGTEAPVFATDEVCRNINRK